MTAHIIDIVDNEPSLLGLFETFLSDTYEVRTATGGREALDLIGPESDVVFLDRRMPGLSGDEVLTEFRTRGLDCLVAFLSAVDPGPEIANLPFDAYLRKPVNRADLLDITDTLLDVATYDSQHRELFRLATKHAALEYAGHADTKAHEHLTNQLTTLPTESADPSELESLNAGFRQ